MNRREKNAFAIRVLLLLAAVMFATLAIIGLCTGRVTTKFGPALSFRTELPWFLGYIAVYIYFAGVAFCSFLKKR
ncbi:MAG: hypothetical protein QM813_22725 [Verrucomicrobiota bacterium]